MAGQRQKAPEQLQGKGSRYRGTKSITLLPVGAECEIPPCPRGVSKAAKDWYAAFCGDLISQLVTDAAWATVHRKLVLMTKREVIEKKIWDEPTVMGSMGQDTINPLINYLKELNREIEKIDSKLGLLPQDQMRLGIAFGQAREALYPEDEGEPEIAEMDYDAIEAEFSAGAQ